MIITVGAGRRWSGPPQRPAEHREEASHGPLPTRTGHGSGCPGPLRPEAGVFENEPRQAWCAGQLLPKYAQPSGCLLGFPGTREVE